MNSLANRLLWPETWQRVHWFNISIKNWNEVTATISAEDRLPIIIVLLLLVDILAALALLIIPAMWAYFTCAGLLIVSTILPKVVGRYCNKTSVLLAFVYIFTAPILVVWLLALKL